MIFTAAPRYRVSVRLLPLLLLAGLPDLHATEPLFCPAGTPLGRFELTVTPEAGGAPRSLQSVNRLLNGDKISYQPDEIPALEKKKARIALLLIPAEGKKIVVSEPKPADQPTSWVVPFRAQLASLVWGPQGLDKAKVTSLVTKDNELIGQLADYASRAAETQQLMEAITQQQALDTGQNVDTAVAEFARQFPSTRLDPTQPATAQVGSLLRTVNPSLSAYDPLAQNPQQQAAQTAGLAASVAGLFFGNGVGLAATGGAVLVNLHGMLFPRTAFLSALAQNSPDSPTGLCGSKPGAAVRTEYAYLWALRIPDAEAPELGLPAVEHLPIGIDSSIPLNVTGADWKLAARVQDWKLVPEGDSGAAVPVPVRVNTTAKTIALDLAGHQFKPGKWKLAANWDWAPLSISGELVLHDFSRFTAAHLTPRSQDRLNAGAGTLDLELTGDDFEFVKKIEYRRQGDPFAQAEALPFHLPRMPPAGPEPSVTVRMDAKPLAPGDYAFLIAQADGAEHETPFKVLPMPPSISATPLVLNTGIDSQIVVLHGAGLDRIQSIAADGAGIALGEAGNGGERSIVVTLAPGVAAGSLLPLRMQVKDFEEPISVPDVFLVAGPKPSITTVRESPPANLGIALNPGEMAAHSLVSFEMNVLHAPAVSAVDVSCEGAPPVKIAMGESKEDTKLTRESPDALFLSLRPERVGHPGCAVMARLITPKSGESIERRLGTIVLLPKIESFRLTDEKAGANAYVGELEGSDLESIAKVGWDSDNGVPVDAIPVPGNKQENLRIEMPWPAPAPHAPLYIWLRGEDHGRLTTVQY